MKGGLTARMLLASAVLALVVAAAFGLLVASVQDLRDAAAASRRVERVAASANALELLLIDLQTGTRGFVITGQERFLEPWRRARARVPEEAARLDALIVSNAQRRRAEAIERAIDEYARTWTEPLIALARRDRQAAAQRITRGEGKQRVDALRRQFDEFKRVEQTLLDARAVEVESTAKRAIVLGLVSLAGSALLIVLFAAYLARAVARPVRRLAAAAARLEGGDLSARVPAAGGGEVRHLGRAFNAMATSLEHGRDELESQNAELELQTGELEAANVELEAQQAELERAVAEVAEEKERADAVYAFTELLASARHEGAASLEPTILQALCDFADADLGVLYAADPERENAFVLRAARGLERDRLPELLLPDEGMPGRALSERRPVTASHGQTGLRLAAFGGDVAVRHELHVPLQHGDGTLGVVTLARLADRPFAADEIEAVASLAAQAAITVSNRNAFVRAQRLASLNRAVLDSTVDAIALVDPDGNPVLTNAAMDRMSRDVLGISSGNAWERADELADRTTDPDTYRASTAAIARDPESEAFYEYRLADSGRWIQRYTRPVHFSSGAPIGRMFVLRDVTAEREAEQLKTQLVATVSHELRTPLASIVGYSELMTLRELPVETHVRYATTIHQEARRLTALINDFLDLQRMEEGTFTLRLEPFELTEVLRAQVEVFALQSASHTIRLAAEDDAFPVSGERDRIAQVVANLLSNAIKYSPEGGSVELSAAARGDYVRVAVRDQGLGIPGAQQPNIFQKFFRVDTSDTREIGGSGLGLALCREIVEAHNGRIGFESEEGKGSTFWFELPFAAAATERSRSAGRILVIEDDREAAALLEAYLTADGHDIEVALSGEQGLASAQADPPALVCLDITLGGRLDGWQVLERLKDDRATERVPVIVCTAGEGRREAAALGAADFLAKPFSGEVLRQTVSRLVGTAPSTVLVVDDDPAIRRLVRETLSGSPIRVLDAADGEEALAVVEGARPDAIVLDLMLPKVDGFAVLARLQERPDTRSLPVVVVTAKRLSRLEREQLRRRAAALLEKSRWSADELRQAVTRALGDRRGERAA